MSRGMPKDAAMEREFFSDLVFKNQQWVTELQLLTA